VISYDTNVLIYALENVSPWAAAAQATVREGEQDGAVLSILAWQELMSGAVLHGSGLDAVLAESLGQLGVTKFVPVSQAICERAVSLARRFGRQIYGYGAVHLATALGHKAGVFVTNDKELLKLRIDGLDIRGLQ
jgi:predicted nucleic acid-binding protein